jgi:hypothetical protein
MVEIGDKLFLKCKFHAANERRLSMQWRKGQVFSFGFFGGGWGKGLEIFIYCLFSMCSYQFPYGLAKFPKTFPIAPQFDPIYFEYSSTFIVYNL